MLLAEIHGKGIPEVQDHEDYLTSAVFGHLRYLPPRIFWQDLFHRAKSIGDQPTALSLVISERSQALASFNTLQIHFWENHRTLGEPDLILCFRSEEQVPLVIILEAKLYAGKTGSGERDQLVRYLQMVNDLPGLQLGLPANCPCFLVYLTPRDSSSEVEESLRLAGNLDKDRNRLFLLRWQDVSDVARRVVHQADEPAKTILNDVTRFLRRRSLEYFDGFTEVVDLPMIEVQPLKLARSPMSGFHGFGEVGGLECIEKLRGEWTK
jgi:hypothetical protein